MSATLDPVDATLADYASLTREAVAAFLSARAPSPYLDVLIREYPSRGGKGIRPALLIATCRAFGGPVREALGVAVALELLHNAFLIHDDFEDSSERRRGRPTLHAMHGAALAINEGKRTLMLLHLLVPSGRGGARGWSSSWARRRRSAAAPTSTRCWRGWSATGASSSGAPTATGWPPRRARRSSWRSPTCPSPSTSRSSASSSRSCSRGPRDRFAASSSDDLLSLTGVEGVHGKDSLGDIREGKRTLILLPHLLRAVGSRRRAWLVEFLGAPEAQRSGADVEQVLAWMERYGSLEVRTRVRRPVGGRGGHGVRAGVRRRARSRARRVRPPAHPVMAHAVRSACVTRLS